jgi:hypothetical protein
MALHFKSTGIDFDALHSGGATTTLMGDYERGTHSPTLMAGSCSWAATAYIRIGDLCYMCGEAHTPNSTFYGSGSVATFSLPFSAVGSRTLGPAMTNRVEFSGTWLTAYGGHGGTVGYYHGHTNSKTTGWVSPKGNNFASNANWYTGWTWTSST